jgi:hypothetical protein
LPDRRRWRPDQIGVYSVNSAYKSLLSLGVVQNLDGNLVIYLERLWGNNIPSKASIFGWRLLVVRLSMHMTLVRKCILVNLLNFCCPFCFRKEEDIDHLFFNCCITTLVWKSVFKLFNVEFIPIEYVCNHFKSFGAFLKNKNCTKAVHLIWIPTI